MTKCALEFFQSYVMRVFVSVVVVVVVFFSFNCISNSVYDLSLEVKKKIYTNLSI